MTSLIRLEELPRQPSLAWQSMMVSTSSFAALSFPNLTEDGFITQNLWCLASLALKSQRQCGNHFLLHMRIWLAGFGEAELVSNGALKRSSLNELQRPGSLSSLQGSNKSQANRKRHTTDSDGASEVICSVSLPHKLAHSWYPWFDWAHVPDSGQSLYHVHYQAFLI